MDPDFEKIARKSGFIFWDKEQKPAPTIDWSCDYTEDLEKFYNLTLDKTIDVIDSLGSLYNKYVEMRDDPNENDIDKAYKTALKDVINAIENYKI